MVNMLTPFPYTMTPMVNISPLSYRDAMTYAAELENIKQYLGTTLPTDLDTRLDEYLTSYQEGIANAEATVDAAKTEWDTRYDAFIANFTDQVKLLNEAAVAGMVPAGAVHDALLTLIDTEIAAATTANHTYTDTAVNGLRTDTDADVARIDADVAAVTAAAAAAGGTNGYLVATFTGNGTLGEKMSLFYSPDGKTVFAGPGNPAYTPTDGQGVRDPSLIYYQGKFFVAYTTNNGNDKDIAIASSTTGAPGSWTLTTVISGASIGGLEQMWAPEFVTGDDGVYLFFTKVAAAKGSMFWVKATNTNLTGWTAPEPVNFTVFPDNWIDGVPVKKNNKWYLFYSVGSGIERAVADTLTGTYTVDRTGNWNGWGSGIEGPILVKDGPLWRAYFDKYVEGSGYWWSESTDLDTWTSPQQVKVGAGVLGPGQTLRHGSFLKLESRDAANKVFAHQFTRQERHLEIYTVPGPTANRNEWAVFAGWQTDTNETTDASIASYDAGTGIVTLNVPGGLYSLSLNTGVTDTDIDNVTRSLAEYGMPDGPQTTFLRQSGGVEDVFGLVVPNHRAKNGERLRFRCLANWTGAQTATNYPARLKITLHGTT